MKADHMRIGLIVSDDLDYGLDLANALGDVGDERQDPSGHPLRGGPSKLPRFQPR